jgi:hypothetical protein
MFAKLVIDLLLNARSEEVMMDVPRHCETLV